MAKESQIPERLLQKEKDARMTAEQAEQLERKVEQHENMLKSIGFKQEEPDARRMAPRRGTQSREETEKRKVGIVNPYALTELILEKKIDWTKDGAKELMEETLESSYEDLIHRDDSILLSCQQKEVTVREEKSRLEMESIANTGQLQKLVKQDNLNILKSKKKGNKLTLDILIPEKRERALSSVHISKAMQQVLRPGMSLKAGDTNSSPSNDLYLEEMGMPTMFVPDRANSIVQGAIGDCYFLAALTSIAWTWPGLLQMDIDQSSDTGHPLSFWHYFTAAKVRYGNSVLEHPGTKTGWAKTDNRFLLKGRCRFPLYARGHRWQDGDYWAAYWEKLYAAWHYYSVKGKYPSNLAEIAESIQLIDGGWPEVSLKEIAGSRFNVASFRLKNQSYQFLYNFFHKRTDAYWATNYPMVLWTFNSTISTIANSHAYSILGCINYDGKLYVVIRNPWGETEPSGAGTLAGSYKLRQIFDQLTLRKGSWDDLYSLSRNDGVFAMELSMVQKQFTGLGYIY